jgi:hypothetical protein
MSTTNITTTDESAATADAATVDAVNIGTTAKLAMPTVDHETDVDSGAGQAQGTLCRKCGASENWNGVSWCPACGYHPVLKRTVEFDQEPATVQPMNLWEVIPSWLWALLFGIVAVVALSFTVRLSVVGNAVLRARWAFAQAAIAEFAALVVFVLAYLYASQTSDRFSPFDLVLKPVEIWKPTFAALPRNAWRVWVFIWAQTALLCAVFVIGGMNYSSLFGDWGVRKRAGTNLTQIIADQARENATEEESLTDALNNSADSSGTAASPDDDDQSEAVAELPTAECLIIGYRKSGGDGIRSLLLATAIGNRMQYVGMISMIGIPEETRLELLERLPTLVQERPFVRCRLRAVWLKPVVMCQVEFKDWTRGKHLIRPKFKQILGNVTLH